MSIGLLVAILILPSASTIIVTLLQLLSKLPRPLVMNIKKWVPAPVTVRGASSLIGLLGPPVNVAGAVLHAASVNEGFAVFVTALIVRGNAVSASAGKSSIGTALNVSTAANARESIFFFIFRHLRHCNIIISYAAARVKGPAATA
jgi:hypothetical protein